MLRKALRQAKAILSTHLPIQFLPTVLESEKVISSQEYQYIKGEHNSVDKSTMLLDMMEKKSITDIRKFLKILKSDNFCGYGYLAEMVERDSEALVKKNKAGMTSSKQSSSLFLARVDDISTPEHDAEGVIHYDHDYHTTNTHWGTCI